MQWNEQVINCVSQYSPFPFVVSWTYHKLHFCNSSRSNMSMFPWHFSQQKRYNSVYNVYDNYSNYGAFNERHNQRQIYQKTFHEPSFCSCQSNYPDNNVQYQNNNEFYTNPDTKNYNGTYYNPSSQMYHPEGVCLILWQYAILIKNEWMKNRK